jgi:hypothetical protein
VFSEIFQEAQQTAKSYTQADYIPWKFLACPSVSALHIFNLLAGIFAYIFNTIFWATKMLR